MRFPAPSPPAAGKSVSSQQVLDTAGQVMQVMIQNVSAVNVYYSTDQGLLDSSTDPNSGIPGVGFILFPSVNPLTIDKFSGKLFIRAAVAGGQVECSANPVC